PACGGSWRGGLRFGVRAILCHSCRSVYRALRPHRRRRRGKAAQARRRKEKAATKAACRTPAGLVAPDAVLGAEPPCSRPISERPGRPVRYRTATCRKTPRAVPRMEASDLGPPAAAAWILHVP